MDDILKFIGCTCAVIVLCVIIAPVLFIGGIMHEMSREFDPAPATRVFKDYYKEQGWQGEIKDVVVKNSGDTRMKRLSTFTYEEVVDGNILKFNGYSDIDKDNNLPEGKIFDDRIKFQALQHNIDLIPYKNIKFHIDGFEGGSLSISETKYDHKAEKEMEKRAKENSDKRLNGYYTAPLKDLLLNSDYKVVFSYSRLVSPNEDIYDDQIMYDFFEKVKSLDFSQLPDGKYVFGFSRYTAQGGSRTSARDNIYIQIKNGQVDYISEEEEKPK